MSNDFYNSNSVPGTGASLSSATVRAEFQAIATGFDKLPALTGNANKAVIINSTGTAMTVTAAALTLALAFTTAGTGSITLTAAGATNVTLPTTGTLATLTGTETLTNKTLTTPAINGTVTTTGLTLPAFTLGGNITGNSKNITGVTTFAATNIDGIIGANTPAAGTFTTLSATTALSIGSSVAAAGEIRLKVGQSIAYRNAGNTADLNLVSITTGNVLTFGGNDQGHIYHNVATGQSIYGQVNGSTVTTTSGTGLAVTGTVTATADIGAAGGTNRNSIVYADGSSGSYSGILQVKRGGTTDGVIYTASTNYNPVSATAADMVFAVSGGGRAIRWSVDNSAIAMTLDSGKSLLLNTTTDPTSGAFPRAPLLIKGMSDSAFAGLQIQASAEDSVLGIGYDGSYYTISTSYRATSAYRGLRISVANGSECARFTTTGYFKASNTGTYIDVNGAHEFYQTSSDYSLKISNQHGSNPSGVQIYHALAANDASAYFLLCNDVSSARLRILRNGGLANFQANDVNLSDLDVKRDFVAYADSATLRDKAWNFGKAMRSAWGQFKYVDQTHDDQNNGYGAQLVEAAAADYFPELVDLQEWGKDADGNPIMRHVVYDSDLMHIVGANVTEAQFRIEDQGNRIAELEAWKSRAEVALAAAGITVH